MRLLNSGQLRLVVAKPNVLTDITSQSLNTSRRDLANQTTTITLQPSTILNNLNSNVSNDQTSQPSSTLNGLTNNQSLGNSRLGSGLVSPGAIAEENTLPYSSISPIREYPPDYWLNSPSDSPTHSQNNEPHDEIGASNSTMDQNSNVRNRRRTYRNLRHDGIRNLLNDNPSDNPMSLNNEPNDNTSNLTEVYEILKARGKENEAAIIKIQQYEEIEQKKFDIKDKLKRKEIQESELSEDDLNLIKRRKRGQKLKEDLENRLFICCDAKVIKVFFADTISSILQTDSKPFSHPSLIRLFNRVFEYLYLQGFVTYKQASINVACLFTAICCVFEEMNELNVGGFRYKEIFIKQMQNIRASLKRAKVQGDVIIILKSYFLFYRYFQFIDYLILKR